MRTRWILNLFLLVLVAGLGWAVLRDLRVARETSVLTGMDPLTIEGVELTRPGRDTVKLERVTGGDWRMTAPYRIGADPERVARLLQVVQAHVVRSFPAEGADLTRLGLAPDPIRISLGGQTLRFGATEPIDRLRYVASGDLVHLTEDLYYHLLVAPAQGFVDPHPFSGLVPVAGDLNGEPLDQETLAAVAALKAERVETLDGDLSGRLLRIQTQGEGEEEAVRFLVSPDGLRWSRPDLRLSYLVASPPLALVDPEFIEVGAQMAPNEAQGEDGIAVPTLPPGTLPEQAVGLVEGLAPGPDGAWSGETLTEELVAEPGGDVGGEQDVLAGAEGSDLAEPLVDPDAPMEMRVERLAPAGSGYAGDGLDPGDAREREIDHAVSSSFGGPPVRSQAQVQRQEAGLPDEDAIVSPEDAAGPPPAVKLRPE